MRSQLAWTVLLFAGMAPSGALAGVNNSVNNAYAVCSIVDSTGMGSQPCVVSGWDSSVTATLDMSSSEARKLCGQIAGLLRQKGLDFDAGWTFRIKSPYSNNNSIAYCDL